MKFKLPDGISWPVHGLLWGVWLLVFAFYMFFVVKPYPMKWADYAFLGMIQISSFYFTAFILLPSAYDAQRFIRKRLIAYLLAEAIGILFIIILLSLLLNNLKIGLDPGKHQAPAPLNAAEVVFLLYAGLLFAGVYFDRNGKNETIAAQDEDLKNAQKAIEEIQDQLSEGELMNLHNALIPHLMNNLLSVMGYVLAYDGINANYVYHIISQLVHFYAKLPLHELIPLGMELEMAHEYIRLQAYKWQEPLNIAFDVDPEVLGMLIIPMQLLLLVENICKYGLVDSKERPAIVQVYKKDNRLVIHSENSIDPNPKPFSKSTKKGLMSLRKSLDLHGREFDLAHEQLEGHFRIHLEIDL